MPAGAGDELHLRILKRRVVNGYCAQAAAGQSGGDGAGRQQGHALAAADKGQQHADQIAGERRAEVNFVGVLGIFNQLANAVHALQHGDGPLVQLLQRCVRRAGQRVLGVHDGVHGLARSAAGGDVAVGGRVVHQPDLRRVFADAAHDLSGAVYLQRDADAGVLLAKLANRPVNQLLGKAFAADHADAAAMQAAHGIDLGQHVMLVGGVLAVVVQNQLTGFGRHYAVAVALQQGKAQFFFQQADLAADGRRYDAQFFGRSAHRAAVHGFKKIAGAGVLECRHA